MFISFLTSPANSLYYSTFFFLLLIVFVNHLRRWRSGPREQQKTKTPPGPPRLPIIGNMHQLIMGSSSLPEHRYLNEIAKLHGPIMHLQLGERSIIVISSPAAAEAMLKKNELNFAQRPVLTSLDMGGYGGAGPIFSPYGDYWRQIRKFCVMELLSAKRVQSFKSVREDEVNNLIQSISSSPSSSSSSSSSGGHRINLSNHLYLLTNSITARAAFGNKCEYADEFIAALKEGVGAAGGFDLLDMFPSLRILPFFGRTKQKLHKAHNTIDKVLDNIINEHEATRAANAGGASKENDLVDVLLNLQQSNDMGFRITRANIKAVILDIFGAGTETSAATIEWAMSEMLKNPEVLQKATHEARQVATNKNKEIMITEEDTKRLQYLTLVIKETLRLHPPVSLFNRECIEKCEINGYDIPMKQNILFNSWALGRDPSYWPDAERFKPERFEGSTIDYKGTNFEYLPFGSGRRICPGISFGITSVEYSLAMLLCHFDWKLPDDVSPSTLDMSEASGMTVKKKNPLYVIATPFSYKT